MVKSGDNKDSVIQIAKKDILENLEKTCPDLYSDWKVQAEIEPLPESYQGNYPKEVRAQIYIREKIRGILRSDLSFVKSVMENGINVYSSEEIAGLLKVLFYFRIENEESLYRKNVAESEKKNAESKRDGTVKDNAGDKGQSVSIKSINAYIKSGNFMYRYDEVYKSLIKSANNTRKEKIVTRKEEWPAAVGFYKDHLIRFQKTIVDLLKGDVGYYTLIAIEYKFLVWYQDIGNAISVMGYLEKNNHNLLNAYYYFAAILENIRDILWLVYLAVVRLKKKKIDMNHFFSEILKDVGRQSEERYDILQNYGLHFLMSNSRKEREIWITSLEQMRKEIDGGQYIDYDEKYSVANLHIEELSEKEIMDKFCEKSSKRMERFLKKYKECEKIYQWFSEKLQKKFIGSKIEALKAIYREVFIYDSIPDRISNKKMKSFVGTIKSRELDDIPNMNEMETYIWEKIRRGIYREKNLLGQYVMRCEFMEKFHKFENDMMKTDNMRGHYLSTWIQILLEKTQWLIESELF